MPPELKWKNAKAIANYSNILHYEESKRSEGQNHEDNWGKVGNR